MARHRSSVALFFGVLLFYGLIAGAWLGYRQWISQVSFGTLKPAYRHYEFIELGLRTRDPALLSRWQRKPPRAAVERDGAVIKTIASVEAVDLTWDASRRAFIGRWPCPWNAPAGVYWPKLLDEKELDERLVRKPFSIEYRRPRPLPRRLAVLTYESVRPFATLKVKDPDGQVKDWRGLLDWVKYVGADAFWVLGGQTPGEKDGQTWVSYNLSYIPQVAQECKKRGIQFGVYAMCYLTMSNKRLARYQYAKDVHDGAPVYTRAISIGDPNRPRDIVAFLNQFKNLPGVDYLGLDYIRNPLGGYEMAERFFAEMPGVKPPPNWDKLSPDERMVWFARKKIMRRDMDFIDAWQWWRAQRMGHVVSWIKTQLGQDKTLWAFTLTWDKGWHHGQDPVMMNDAGVDADALMLYEADEPQFAQMLKDWRRYVKQDDVQLLVGDVVDLPLHQNSPLGPKEFYNRMVRAMNQIYPDGPSAGIFVHDLARALWGRLGVYTTKNWMDEARAAVRQFKQLQPPPARKEPPSPMRHAPARAATR